jgi:hypothetical protein
MLRINLIFALALLGWPLAALAQNNGAEVLQIFEFDYDQTAAPVVNLPPKTEAPAPAKASAAAAAQPAKPAATAPAKASAATPAQPAKPAAATPAKASAPSPATPAKPATASPAKPAATTPARAPAPTKPAATPPRMFKDGVITIIGEPDPPGTQYDDYQHDYRAVVIILKREPSWKRCWEGRIPIMSHR